MGFYLLRRFLNYLAMTFLVTLATYITASLTLDPRKRYEGRNPPIPEASQDQILNNLGVNNKVPILERTWDWLQQLFLHGSLGKTINQVEVTQEIALRAGVSLRLLIVGSLLAAIVGVVLGVWGAVRQYKFSDQVVTYASYLSISTPTFVAGIILMILAVRFNGLIGQDLIRFVGPYTPGTPPGFWPQFTDTVSHMLLPTLALIIIHGAIYSRYQRSTMLDVLGADFIRTARAKGRTRRSALFRHGVRVALIPMSTYFAYSFGTLLAGATFLEIVFSWHGMGEFGVQAIQQADINAVTGTIAFAAILILVSSMLSEVLYAALDPRVRS